MKIKDGYLLREMAGSFVVIPVGESAVDLNGMITLTETGALIWKKLEQGADEQQILNAMLQEYEIDRETALKDIRAFVKKLVDAGIVTE